MVGCSLNAVDVVEAVCTHDNVSSRRCHLHRGWCGTCLDCGKKVHAPYDTFLAVKKEVYRETKFHSEMGI
jgi:hypothetical protein